MDLFKNIKVISFLIFCFLFILIPSKIFSQVVINEFSSAAGSSSDPDWVEIYNSGSESIDLSLYRLRDDTETNKKDLEGTLNPGGFAVFEWSNKLNNSGDIIKLLLISSETNFIDQVAYGDLGNDIPAPTTGQSAGRYPDGSATWSIFSSSSKGITNNAQSPVFTPTPTPTDEPTPTEVPIPTKTPTPTSVPSATKTPTPKPTTKIVNTPTSTPKLVSQNQGTMGQVLGQQEATSSSSSSGNTKELTQPSLITGAKISLILGLLFCGTAVIVFTQRVQNLKKVDDKT